MGTQAPIKREVYEPCETPRRVALPAANPLRWIFPWKKEPVRKPEKVEVRRC